MIEIYLGSSPWLGTLFLGIALVATLLFMIRMGFQFFTGGDGLADVSTDVSDASFQWLSIEGLSAFFMLFGWVGLAMMASFPELPIFVSILTAVMAGVLALWLMRRLFQGMAKLQSSGTLDISTAIGQEGSVYLSIPAGGVGKVQVTVHNRMVIYDALAEGGASFQTGDRVKITQITPNRQFVVTQLDA